MSDTIVAIATALSPSGIGIIRISGDDAFLIADRVFKKPDGKKLSDLPSHTVHYGHVVEYKSKMHIKTKESSGNAEDAKTDESFNNTEDVKIYEIVDEAMAVLMRAPHSFTKEDVVELDCHGGIYVLKRVLDLCIQNGCRLAEPGEFTKRAFLNGRIDLSEAEAVMDLISSSNENARKNSVKQLNGRLRNIITEIRSEVIYEIAAIESAIDDPEHYEAEDFYNRLTNVVGKWTKELNRLSASFENGRMHLQGIKTAIVGKPNVGKSSFLNLLLGEERAIVTTVAGTTRDTLEENVSLDGITLHLIDTAGIHETEDEVEKIGVKKAKDAIEDADLIIFLIDSSDGISEEDKNLIPLIKEKPIIALLNKSDKSDLKTEEKEVLSLFSKSEEKPFVLSFSAKTGDGLAVLTGQIKKMFFEGSLNSEDEIYLTSIRHKNLVEDALKALLHVSESLENHMPEDFYAIDLMQAYASLGAIIGEEVDDDLVDEIFSKFCMGK